MHRLLSLLPLLILAFSLSSCRHTHPPAPMTIDIDEALKTKGELRLSEIATSVEFITLNGLDDKIQIQPSARQFFIGEKVISVVNPNPSEVILLSRSGKLIRKIGDPGKGPGEYLGALVHQVNEELETILIADNASKKFLIFDFTGKCLSERAFKSYPDIELTRIGGIVLTPDGNYILDNEWLPSAKGICYNLLVMNQDLEIVTGLLAGKPESGSFRVSMNPGRLQEFNQNLKYWAKSTDTLFNISEQLDLQPVYLFKTKDQRVFDDSARQVISGHVSITHVMETGQYFIMEGIDHDRRFMLSCNKATGLGTRIFASGNCGLSFGDKSGIENDLFGYSPVSIRDVAQVNNGRLVLILYPGIIGVIDQWLKGKFASCLRSAKVLLPDKRDELVRLIENPDKNPGPILMVITLK